MDEGMKIPEDLEQAAEELANAEYHPHRLGDCPAWFAACVRLAKQVITLRTDLESVALALFRPGKTYQNCQLAMEVQKLRTERDEFERKGKDLCCSYGNALIEIATLKATLEQMQKPVTAAEFKEIAHKDDWGVDCIYLSTLNDFIASRAQKAGQ